MSRNTVLLAPTLLDRPSLSQTTSPNQPTLFLIADSTVRNGNGTGANNQLGWGEPLAAYFDSAKLQVLHRARGGLSSRMVLSEGRRPQELADLKAVCFVIVHFSRNASTPLL